jgi:hypothetical protein
VKNECHNAGGMPLLERVRRCVRPDGKRLHKRGPHHIVGMLATRDEGRVDGLRKRRRRWDLRRRCTMIRKRQTTHRYMMATRIGSICGSRGSAEGVGHCRSSWRPGPMLSSPLVTIKSKEYQCGGKRLSLLEPRMGGNRITGQVAQVECPTGSRSEHGSRAPTGRPCASFSKKASRCRPPQPPWQAPS